MLNAAKPIRRTVVLLGINGGMEPCDALALRWGEYDPVKAILCRVSGARRLAASQEL